MMKYRVAVRKSAMGLAKEDAMELLKVDAMWLLKLDVGNLLITLHLCFMDHTIFNDEKEETTKVSDIIEITINEGV